MSDELRQDGRENGTSRVQPRLVDPRGDPFSEIWERSDGSEMKGETVAWVSDPSGMAPLGLILQMVNGAIKLAMERNIARLLPGYRVSCALKEGPISAASLRIIGVRPPHGAVAAAVYVWHARKEVQDGTQ